MTQYSAADQATEDLLAHAMDTRAVHQRAEADVPAALCAVSDRVRHLRTQYTAADPHHNATRARLDNAARDALAAPGALSVLIRFADEHELPGRRSGPATGDLDLMIQGALLFGCLLHLSAHPISAIFWWKLAAGAGDPTAATCLYLQHVIRGDNHEGFLWFNQAIALDRAAQPQSPPPSLPDIDGWHQIVARLLPAHHSLTSTPIPCADLAPALDRLVTRFDYDQGDPDIDLDGIAARPDPSFTRSLEALT